MKKHDEDEVTHYSSPPRFEDEEAAPDIINGGDFFQCLFDITPVKAPQPPAAMNSAVSMDSLMANYSAASSRFVDTSSSSLLLSLCCYNAAALDMQCQRDAGIEDSAEMPLTVPDTPR